MGIRRYKLDSMIDLEKSIKILRTSRDLVETYRKHEPAFMRAAYLHGRATADEIDTITHRLRRRRSGVDESGTYIFKRWIHKKRYLVFKIDEDQYPKVTNAEIRYRKSRKCWGYYIDCDFTGVEYKTLKQAKAALGPTIVDRLAAEFDPEQTS